MSCLFDNADKKFFILEVTNFLWTEKRIHKFVLAYSKRVTARDFSDILEARYDLTDATRFD
jgi:hypothetical protein